MCNGTENWKVGTVLVHNSSICYGASQIVRETAKMWVLNNNVKIRKGERKPIGERGFGSRTFYSVDESEGKKIVDAIEKFKMCSILTGYSWNKLDNEELKKVIEFVRSVVNEKGKEIKK